MIKELLAIYWMCYTTKRSACLCACVDTHTWLLLFPEPSANVATRVHPLSPVRTVLAPGTEHSLQTRHFSHSILFHLHHHPWRWGWSSSLFHRWGNWGSSEHQSHITSGSQTAAWGPNHLAAGFCNESFSSFTGTQLHTSVYILSRAAFTSKWQHWVSCSRDLVACNLKLCPLTLYRKSLLTHVFGNGAKCKPLSPSLTAHQQTKAGRARKKVPRLWPISCEHKTSVEQHLFTCPWNILEMLVWMR